jgi:cytochrome oxidase Cu insertion factor (SCO1/SenC/PrrC family)
MQKISGHFITAGIFTLSFLLALALAFCGCTTTNVQPVSVEAPSSALVWRTYDLEDVNTQATFNISNLSGKPVLLYAFTISCPICTRQQQEIALLRKDAGDSFYAVGLDIDPNEDAASLREHIQKNGFYGYYALSPLEMTQSLLDEFGIEVITPASAPMILILPDGTVRKLPPNIKSAAYLRQEMGLPA